jgi:hypothetical protein
MILPHLNLSSTQELTTVSAGQCLSLDRLYQASQCVLYQRSLSQARRDPSKLRHRGLCIDAAMALLAHQVTIYSEFTSSGPYCLEKRHIHTLTTHDYFISSMAVALDLYYGFESEPFAPSPSDFSLWGYDRRAKMISALETSNEFCRGCKCLWNVLLRCCQGQGSPTDDRKAATGSGSSSATGQSSNADTTAPVS